MPSLHSLNIIVHVVTGCAVILGGLVLLSRKKGDKAHRFIGRTTVAIATVSMAAALLGAIVFRGKADLVGVSLLVSYHLWAGVRALRLRHNGRGWADLGPAIMAVAAGGILYGLYRQGGDVAWEPARVYAAVGGLVFYGGWDVVRTVFPAGWRLWLNPAEHAFRMTSLTGATVSVAAGTLLPGQAIYAALLPSGAFAVLAFLLAWRAARMALGVAPSAALKARLKAESEL